MSFGIIAFEQMRLMFAGMHRFGACIMMLVGQTIGPFEIEKEIGSGAMGSVYRARYLKNNKSCAIKVIAAGLGDNERVQQRFEREAEILKQLRHPNIVRLYAVGKYHRSPFYAMEYIDGEPLDTLLRKRGSLSWEEVVDLGKQICAALQHAHDNGIIHRDLKPSNLMIERSGTLKLTDFGIAKDTDVTGLTSANSTVGTAAYMSPEQCRGERELTNKSDLYSLGILFYELLTGQKPFQAENAMDMFIQHVQGQFDRPAHLVPEIPVWMDNLVCQLMEKKPELRPIDAATVAKALDEVVQKVEARRSAGEEVASKGPKKNKSRADRQTAEELFGKRPKKRKKLSAEGENGNWAKVITAVFLLMVLAGLVAFIVYAVQPPTAAELLKQGNKLLSEGDALFEASEPGDDACWQKWTTAQEKYFGRIVALYPDSPEAVEAKKQLEYISDGKAYLRCRKRLTADNWQKQRGDFDALLDKLGTGQTPADLPGGKFISMAQSDLAPHEAPHLFSEGKKHYDRIFADSSAYDAASSQHWQRAKEHLGKLVNRYLAIGDPAARDGKILLDRVLAFELAIGWMQRGDVVADPVHADFVRVIKIDKEAVSPSVARKAWVDFRTAGSRAEAGSRAPASEPKYRVFYEIAEEKLRNLPTTSS